MKKTLLVLFAAIAFAAVAAAQPKAIGGKLGSQGVQASYEHYLGGPNFIEANLGIDIEHDLGFNVSGIYNFVFAQPNWTPRGDWAWYAGPGVTFGTMYYNGKYIKQKDKAFFGLVGQIGCEYQFWFPLQVSADFRPTVAFCDGSAFFRTLYALCPTISVRYTF